MRYQRVVPFFVLFMLFPSSILAAADPRQTSEELTELTSCLLEEYVDFHFTFEPSGVEFFDIEGFLGIAKEGMGSNAVSGEPFVPVSFHSFVLDPYASDVQIEIVSSTFHTIAAPGPILGVPEQVPIGLQEDPPPKEYSIPLDGPLRLITPGRVRGYFIQDLVFQPVLPRPDGSLAIYESVEGRIWFSFPVDGEKTSTITRSTSVFRSYLEGMLENPEDLDRFGARPLNSPASSPLQKDDVQYVIVTNSVMVGDHLSKIRDWKQQKGVPSKIVEMSFITSNYNGSDNQEKVRNFIKDAVSAWETEYVLLGGDISVIPYRSTYVKSGSYVETDCAADLYYSDLDGSFNADNDSIYGEVEDKVDLRPDVIVGRAPAQSSAEMNTFVAKTLKYEIDPLAGYLNNMTLAGEYLDANTNSSLGMDLIKNKLLPPNVNATSLYDSAQGVFGNLDRPNFMGQVNGGLSYAFHSGHSNYNVMSVGTASQSSLYNSDIPNYNGGYRIGVMNSLGCIANRFSVNDCIGELHVMESDGGSVAFIGNSRYGWYAPYNPGSGTSEVYMYRMAAELFSNGNTNMGAHFALAKNAYVGWSASNNSYRWLQMALNLMGEPEMHVRTGEPDTFNITLPDNIGRSYPDFNITVRNSSGSPVINALVCLQQSGYYAYNLTNSNGKAYFNFSTRNFDNVNITATGYNFRPFTGNISIDVKPPTLAILSSGYATTGDEYIFKCQAYDEAGIQQVLLDLRTEGQGINGSTTNEMFPEDANWTFPVIVAFNSTDDLIYRIRARDNSGNWNETPWYNVDVIDNDAPWFIDDLTNSTATTGGTVDFLVYAEDNINVSSVMLFLSWDGSDEVDTRSMLHYSGGWMLTWDVPVDRIGTLNYSAAVYDGAGNLNDSLEGSLEVQDNDAPIFLQDLSDRSGTTSDSYRFAVSVEDNIGLEGVFVEYWRRNYPDPETIPMAKEEGLWTLSIQLSSTDLTFLHHIFHAVDTSGNWAHSGENTTNITDNDEPVFIRDWSSGNTTTGDPFEFRVSVSDNTMVGSVALYCSIRAGSLEMELQDDGVNWTAVVDPPVDSLQGINYHFQARDIFGNTNISNNRTVQVLDNDPPTFGPLQAPGTVNAGDNLTMTVEIVDNIGVVHAELEWWLGGSSDKTLSELTRVPGGHSATFRIPLEAYGTVYYRVRASDPSGNSGTSPRYEASIMEYIPGESGDDDIPDDDEPIGPGDDDIPDDDDDMIPSEGEDLDGDGMDDNWEYLNGLDPSTDDSMLDRDGDGYSNLDEFRAGSDPQNDSSFPSPQNDSGPDEDIPHLLIVMLIVVAVLCLLGLIAAVAMTVGKRSGESTDVMVLDEDDEIMSWE
ncbi:MAG: hypothetical protein JW939_01850 [Candidatus Thermoplasmatota archaeon]|nr:hypothetical protein [Candidatus Thermoplasmatota archaeon]